jgi:basic membrane protein A
MSDLWDLDALAEERVTRDQLLRRGAALGLSLGALGSVLAGEAGAAGGGGKSQVRAAWVYVAPIGDGGWTFQHNLGRLYAQKILGSRLKSTFVENVPENPSVATRVISGLAKKNDIVFTTSFGFMDPTLTVAKQNPNVYFEHCSGFKSAPNMGNYFGAMEQARFLSGIAAGKETKSGKLGYVAAFPIPEVVRGLNTFTLGVRSVNPSATVRVVWTSTWFDPGKERSAAESLLSVGADVLGQHQDSPATGQAAQDEGRFWVGYDSDMRRFAPNAFLTAPVWAWGPYYLRRLKAVLDGTWKTDSYYGNMRDGMIRIAPPSALVDAATKAQIAKKQADIKSGAYNVLQGPIRDQSGKIRIPAGKVMSLGDALSWDWLVQGVEGTIPKS